MNPECGAFFNPCSNFLVTCDNYFDSLVIKKASAREWELKLKKILWDWCKNGYVRDEANRVLAELAYVPQGRIECLELALMFKSCRSRSKFLRL